MKNYFPENLKHLRVQKGMTQDDLAKKMDKDYSTIGKWELGQRNPIMADIIKIADIFNISVQDLVEKDLRFNQEEKTDELDILYSKTKDILSDEDRELIRFSMQRAIDRYEEEKNKGN